MTNPGIVRDIAPTLKPGERIGTITTKKVDLANHQPKTETIGVFFDAKLPDEVKAELKAEGALDSIHTAVVANRVDRQRDDVVGIAVAETGDHEGIVALAIDPARPGRDIDPEMATGGLSVLMGEHGLDRVHLPQNDLGISPGLAEVIGFRPEPDGGYVFDRSAA